MTRQQEVLNYLSTVPHATLDEIYRKVSFSYYHNENKHLGALISRMIKNGTVERIKPGLFKFKQFNRKCSRTAEPKNQIKLF